MLNLFLYEFKHFKNSSAKVIIYLIFLLACFYSIHTGFELQNSQNETILNIKLEHDKAIYELFNWFDNGLSGPEGKSWIDISNPTWALSLTPQYTIKEPSPLLPLGLGQAEQFGFYKKITNWSSTYDNDMVEELTNPERLVNGNIDFSFLIVFLLPVLLIILIYNIRGLEQDFLFERLINGAVAIRSTNNVMLIFFYTMLIWLMYAFSTYYALLSTGIFIKWYEVCVLMISTTLAISVPAAPAYVGTYHATVVYVLTTFFLINQLEAQASAIIIHAVGTIPFIIIGAWYFINSSVSIREINAKELINN